MTLPSIIIPDVKQLQTRQQLDWYDFLQQWRADYAAGIEKIPPPESVRHIHDPEWRNRVMSITNARARGHWVWQITAELFFLAQIGWALSFRLF